MILKVKYEFPIEENRLRYVLDFIENHSANDNQLKFAISREDIGDLVLEYGKNRGEGFYMPLDGYLFCKGFPEKNRMVAQPFVLGDSVLYGVSKVNSGENREFFTNRQFGFDLFETIFFHLSRIEEIWQENSPGYTWEKYNEHDFLLIRENLNEIPVVDQLIIAFLQVLGLEVKQKTSDFTMTHDIDKVYKYHHLLDGVKAALWPVFFRRSLLEGYKNAIYYFRVLNGTIKDPYNSFKFLLRKEKFWKEKIIFFMAGGKSHYDLFDKYYEKYFPEILNKSRLEGYSIGIHPSFNTAEDQKMLNSELNYLSIKAEQSIEFSRQHWLRFFHRSTPAILERADIQIDHTLGYRRHIGFRCGTGYAYPLYYFQEERAYRFLCQPLIIMDSSMLHFVKDDIGKLSRLLVEFLFRNRYNTCISMNFHNSTFDYTFKDRRYMVQIYEDMVNLLQSFADGDHNILI